MTTERARTTRWIATGLAVVALPTVGYFATRDAPTAPVDRQPDVLMVMVDTLRADHLGCYGYARPTSPNIDKVAEGGVLFEHAYASAPWTPPSIASLFSSLLPDAHHVQQYSGAYGTPGAELQGDRMASEIETLAESFARAGYQTAAFVANPWVTRREGYDQGFEIFRGAAASSDDVPPAAAINKAVLSFLDNRRDAQRPLFLYVHYMDVHGPYNAPDAFREPFVNEVKRSPRTAGMSSSQRMRPGGLVNIEPRTERKDEAWVDQPAYWAALYDAGIASFDDQLGVLLAQLRRRGLLDTAILAVLADHGEQLGDHGGWDHGDSLYDHQLHVPLILSWPGHLARGQSRDTIVSLIDVGPTLLELCGLEEIRTHQGRSFAALARTAATDPDRFAVAEGVKMADYIKAIYMGRHKMIVDTRARQVNVFDMRGDPRERRMLPSSEELDAVFQRLRARMTRTMTETREIGVRFSAETAPLPEDTRERLRSLGYLD